MVPNCTTERVTLVRAVVFRGDGTIQMERVTPVQRSNLKRAVCCRLFQVQVFLRDEQGSFKKHHLITDGMVGRSILSTNE